MEKTYNKLVKGIKNYFKKSGFKKAVIGLSGGIDSALSLRLVSDAIGNKNITAILMPEKGLTKLVNVEDSINLCKSLKVSYKIIEINKILNNFKKIKIKQNKDSWTNTKARIRAAILYNFANANKALVVGTSNKIEIILGYFTKYGDGAVDLEVIGSLYKTEVFKLSEYLNLPKEIINKTPSAELFKGHTDESEIGASYDTIDKILRANKFNSEIGKKLKRRIDANKHKSSMPPVI
ncbi:MAG: NAD+ synthase [Nanoarchaeota archaeon]|nr:NAD+ synthase [Nanoarchaeota archaeon]